MICYKPACAFWHIDTTVAFPIFGKKPAQPLPGKAPSRPVGTTAPRRVDDDLAPLDFPQAGAANSADDELTIEVQDAGRAIPEAIEQAAMLYSIDQAEAASGALEAAIQSEDLGRHTARAWGMLFELYQCLGRRQDFEQLAATYAAKFETSPPTWTDGKEQAVAAAPKGPMTRTSVSLSGLLSARAEETLKLAFKIAETHPTVRIEVGKLTDADDQGCALLSGVIRQLKKARKECVLGGAAHLGTVLAKKIASGTAEHEPIWLLLLEIQQQLANQEAFDDLAVNYAITFEVSPPSYEAPKTRPVPAGAKTEPEVEEEPEEDDDCVLEGEITSATENAFATIKAHAEHATDIVVDVSHLKRMDFVAATNLMNLIATLAATQKRVRLIKASQLVTALWEVIGLDGVARIETRKA